jgi:hypothetical protein
MTVARPAEAADVPEGKGRLAVSIEKEESKP